MSNSWQPPSPSVHGILQQEYYTVLPCPPPGDLPDPGIEPASLMSPALAGGIFTTSPIWEASGILVFKYLVYHPFLLITKETSRNKYTPYVLGLYNILI